MSSSYARRQCFKTMAKHAAAKKGASFRIEYGAVPCALGFSLFRVFPPARDLSPSVRSTADWTGRACGLLRSKSFSHFTIARVDRVRARLVSRQTWFDRRLNDTISADFSKLHRPP